MSHGKLSGFELPGPFMTFMPEADAAHGLDAAGDADVDGVRGNEALDEVVGLLRRTALAVDGGRRRLVGAGRG